MGIFDRGRRGPRYGTYSPDKQSRANALTASGFRVKQRDGDVMRRLIQPWQARAFAYYDLVPEIKYAAQFYSRALSVLRLYPAVRNERGDMEETTDPDAVEQLQRIQDPGGGTSGLLSSYGRLMFLAGECYLFVSENRETGSEQWEMLSTDELRVTGWNYVRYKAPSMQAENYAEPPDDEWDQPITGEPDNNASLQSYDTGTAVAYRIWKRHPRYSFLADSTMQGVLDVAEEIVLLTQVIRSRARSRMAGAGVLIVNGNVTPIPMETVPDEDPEEDPFVRELTLAMTSPIVDEGTAAAVVPIVVRVDVDKDSGGIDNVMKHIQLVDPVQIYPETGLRFELIKRLAIGLDMPPEVLLGMEDVNHWSAWSIDEQTWKSHLQPVAQQLVDDLTSAFYQPTMRALGKEDWQDYFIAYDATAVINHPDRSKDANELYDRHAIGKRALRDAKGFDEEDAPSEEELWEQVGIALRDASYVKYGIPSKLGTGGVETAPGEIVSDQGDSPPLPAGEAKPKVGETGPNGPPSQNGKTAEPVTAAANGNGHATEAFVSRILGAADLALYRARELAGNRLRNIAKRDPAILKTLDGVRPRDVAHTLGRETSKQLGAPPSRELVAGARDFIIDALRIWGIDDTIVAPIGDRIEQHAAKTLFDEHPAPLPQSFSTYVAGMKDAANV